MRSTEFALGLTGTNSLKTLRFLAVFTLHYYLHLLLNLEIQSHSAYSTWLVRRWGGQKGFATNCRNSVEVGVSSVSFLESLRPKDKLDHSSNPVDLRPLSFIWLLCNWATLWLWSTLSAAVGSSAQSSWHRDRPVALNRSIVLPVGWLWFFPCFENYK